MVLSKDGAEELSDSAMRLGLGLNDTKLGRIRFA